LRCFVASLARLEKIEAALRLEEDPANPRFMSLSDLVHREAKTVMALGRTLRVSPQAIRDGRVLRLAASTPEIKPWETGDGDGAA